MSFPSGSALDHLKGFPTGHITFFVRIVATQDKIKKIFNSSSRLLKGFYVSNAKNNSIILFNLLKYLVNIFLLIYLEIFRHRMSFEDFI